MGQRRAFPSPLELAMRLGQYARETRSSPIPPGALQALLSTSNQDWRRLGASAYTLLRSELRSFERTSTVASLGGLLTAPEFHVGTLRLELLQHIAVSACRGTQRAKEADLRRWVNDVLGELRVRSMEDPVEDVFVSNVIAPGGNYRLFEGVWELNDSSVQALVEALVRSPWRRKVPLMLPSILALLRLSEVVAERAGTPRWVATERTAPETELLPLGLDLDALRARVKVSWEDLESLGIPTPVLEPFVLAEALYGRLRSESFGHTSLERFPLLRVEDGLILACPPAVSPAIRRYVLETCEQEGATEGLASALRWVHARAVFDSALPRIDAAVGVDSVALPAAPATPSEPLPWDEVHCPIDVDKAAIVVLLPDSLVDAARTGLSEPMHDPERSRRLAGHLRETATRLAATATAGGLVVVVYAGVGRGLVFGVPRLPARWHTIVMSAGDFGTFARSPGASLLRLWKLEEQRDRLSKAGIDVPDTNGTLNTFAFWTKRAFALAPTDMPYPAESRGLVQIGTDFVHGFRVAERRLHDVHAAALDQGSTRTVRVHRHGRAVFFPSMLKRPLFVSEEAAVTGELMGVCEHPALTVWVMASKPTEASQAAYFMYQLWEAALTWLDRLLPEVVSGVAELWQAENSGSSRDDAPLQLILELADEDEWRSFQEPGEPAAESPNIQVDADRHRIVVSIPFGFISLLRQPANDGERALLTAVAEALLVLLGPQEAGAVPSLEQLRTMAGGAVAKAMRNADARHVHLFEAERPTDHIAALGQGRDPEPRFVFDEDVAAWTDGLAWQVLERDALPLDGDSRYANEPSGPSSARVISGRIECARALGALVDVIWKRLRSNLEEVNGPSLVTLALENLESIARDRGQWRRTARALLALYGEADDVPAISIEREAHRTTASLAGRVLVEMAVCTCPPDRGRRAALTDLDQLVAGVSELVGLAFDSDAIHSGLTAARVRIEPNGVVSSDRTFMLDVVIPFSSEVQRSEFHAAVDAYHKLYRRRPASGAGGWAQTHFDESDDDDQGQPNTDAGATNPAFDAVFTAAFKAEFGLTPNRVIDGFAELHEVGMEAERLVVSTTRGFLASRLSARRSFSAAEVSSFFAMLALAPRPQWDVAPPGFRSRDWQPWRFRRRLSLIARPMVACGPIDEDATQVLYGLDHLGASITYLFENAQSAWLPAEFFTSDEMIRYRGRVADEEGAAFTQEVANRLRALGWNTVTEIKMATLGARAELGDLDVVAWLDGDPRVLLVECKRLQPARTVGEIGEVLKQFRGEGSDRLGRHIRRCDWVRAHPEALARHLGISILGADVTPALVTNRQVPVRFQSGLPLSSDQIIAYDVLGELLTPRGGA